jgi:eukaryotic-like serine/threonine-protein kinase
MNGTSTVRSGVFAGRYLIERELGRGGTAIVYLARDQQRGHPVAIKILRPEFAESIGAERFLKEIRLTQQLHHPQIVPVLDSGKHEGQLFFVLPHMEGGTLRDRLQRDKQLPLEEAVAITRSIANALGHAHEKGLIHRDVKPENILFTSTQACLSDFGIARALERSMDESTTSTSIVRGTPPYMSPEQASGETSLDGRSDIYSLGCVVYEMLAGMQPFVGPTPQSVIAQRLIHPPRPLRTYRPGLSKAVETVLERALAITRADRYQKATDFADALDLAARTPDDPSRVASARRLRRVRYGAVGAGAAVAVAGIVAAIMAWIAPRRVEAGIPEGDPRRIAVLYFDDRSPETVPPHVVDGISEDLIDQLGSVSALHVISPNGVRPFRESAAPVDSVGRALKVGTIVSGTVARSGNTIRINVRLIEAATGQQLYNKQLEQEWTELFALQDKLAAQVAFYLRERLGQEIELRRTRAATKSYAAWEAVQLAGNLVRRASEAERRRDPQARLFLLQADSLYARAELLDPAWIHPTIRRSRAALAMASWAPMPPVLADSLVYRRMTPLERRALWIGRAIQLTDDVLRRERTSPDALALRGEARYALLVTGTPVDDTLAAAAERDVRAALDLRPDVAGAWNTLGNLALREGRFAEAAAAMQRAYESDAFFESRRVVSLAFFASLHSEQFEDARRWCALGLSRYAGDPRFTECELTLQGWTGRTRKDVSAAWRLLGEIEQRDTVRMLTPTQGYRRLMVAAVLARAQMLDSARSLLRQMDAERATDSTRRTPPLVEGYVRLLVGDRAGAITRLGDHLRTAPETRHQLARHPWFRSLHGDPRFEALVQPAR